MNYQNLSAVSGTNAKGMQWNSLTKIARKYVSGLCYICCNFDKEDREIAYSTLRQDAFDKIESLKNSGNLEQLKDWIAPVKSISKKPAMKKIFQNNMAYMKNHDYVYVVSLTGHKKAGDSYRLLDKISEEDKEKIDIDRILQPIFNTAWSKILGDGSKKNSKKSRSKFINMTRENNDKRETHEIVLRGEGSNGDQIPPFTIEIDSFSDTVNIHNASGHTLHELIDTQNYMRVFADIEPPNHNENDMVPIKDIEHAIILRL